MGALGHADPKSSIRYQSSNPDMMRDAMEKIAPLSLGRDGSSDRAVAVGSRLKHLLVTERLEIKP